MPLCLLVFYTTHKTLPWYILILNQIYLVIFLIKYLKDLPVFLITHIIYLTVYLTDISIFNSIFR